MPLQPLDEEDPGQSFLHFLVANVSQGSVKVGLKFNSTTEKKNAITTNIEIF